MDEKKNMSVQRRESAVEQTRERTAFAPDADILETDEAVVVVADMPGVDEKSAGVELENDVLTIHGLTHLTFPEGLTPLHCEFGVKEYRRSFAVGVDIDRDRIRAEMRNGVLRVNLPKSPAARPRRITVEAAAGDNGPETGKE